MLDNMDDVVLARCESVAEYKGKEYGQRYVDGYVDEHEVIRKRQSIALTLLCVVLGPTAPVDDKAVAVYGSLVRAFNRGKASAV